MAQELQDRPEIDGGEANPDNPEWYDKTLRQIRDLPETDEPSPKSIAEREALAGTRDGNSSALEENEGRLGKENSLGKGYSGKAKTKIKGWSRRRKAVAGFGIGLAGGSIIFAAVPMLAPLKLIQFGQLLRQTHFFQNEDFGNDRTSKLTLLRRYSKTGTVQGTRLGTISGKYADKWDVRLLNESGVRPLYDGTTGRMSGFEIMDETKARSLIDSMEAEGVNTNGSRDNLNAGRGGDTNITGQVIDLRGTSAGKRRGVIKSAVNLTGHNKISSFVGSRLLIKLGGVDFHPFKNTGMRAGESFLDWKRRRSAEHQEAIRNGAQDVNIPNAEGETDADGEGNDRDRVITDANGNSVSSGETAGYINDPLDAAKAPDADLPDIKRGVVQRALGGGAAAAAAIGILCAAKDLGDSGAAQRFSNTVMIPMRIGFEGMAISAQLLTLQGLSLEEIQYFWDLMTDDETGQDIFAAAAVQGAGGKPATGPDIDASVIPSEGNEKPQFFQILDQIPLLGTACSVQEGIGGFIRGIPLVGEVMNIVDVATGAVIDAVLEGASGYTTADLIGMAIDMIAGVAVDPLVDGPDRGNVAMYGALYASNAQNLATGGVVQEGTAAAELEEYRLAALEEEKKTAGLFEKYFDFSNPQSLASYAVRESPNGYHQTLASLQSAFTQPLAFAGGLSSVFSGKASAANTYQYQVPRVAFSPSEQDSDLIDDPFLNADYVEANFESLNGSFGKCFPNKLTLTGNDITLDVDSFTEEPVTQFNQPDGCKSEELNVQGRNDFLRFRAYLADVTTMKSLNCYEGDDAACRELSFNGISTTSPTSTTTTISAPGLNGYAIPCEGQPTPVDRQTTGSTVRSNWDALQNSGTIGTTSDDKPINVYIREACDQTNPRTILIVSSIHGSENGGQLIGHELLYNENLPDDVRVIVVPELNKYGIDFRVLNDYGGRVNANHVNLNRNSDYRWSSMDGLSDNTSPSSTNYRGPAPNSEPETQAIQSLILSLGDIDLSLHYHDDLYYVGSAGSNAGLPMANLYAQTSGMPLGNKGGAIIYQRGSLDGWQAEHTGDPVLLIELGTDQSTTVIDRNVDAIQAIIGSGLLQ